MNDAPPPPEASVRTPSRFHFIWLVPIVAAALAIYLGVETLVSRGPLITITFSNGQGLSVGQTTVQHNAVSLGTVQGMSLSDDFKQVVVTVRLEKNAKRLLNSNTRFWVVRPRFSLTDFSGLQTLVSGSYIAVDPGPPGGKPQTEFRGLDQPPGIRFDQPGRTFTLQAPTLGWLNVGAPVFYRNISVGRLLSFEDAGPGRPIDLHVFIRAPFDRYVRRDTHFWNSSGVTANIGPNGVHVALESVEAVLAGGIEFANFENAAHSPEPDRTTVFELYNGFDEAQNAGFRDNIHFVAYFGQSVAGVQAGSAVQLFGIRVGTVTNTRLILDPSNVQPRVRVAFDVQPERVFPPDAVPKDQPTEITRKLIALGMRARVDTGNLLTGQAVIGLDIVPHPTPASVSTEDGALVMPSQAGGLQNLTDSLSDIATRLSAIPFEKLGANANDLLESVRALVVAADSELRPIGREIPAMSQQVQTTLRKTDQLLSSLQASYGASSDTHQNLQELTNEATEAVRSIRELTDYLGNHPGSVLWGRK